MARPEWSSETGRRLERARWRRHWVATDKPTAPARASLETLHDGQSCASEAWMRRRKFTLLLGGAIALTASPSKAQKSAKVPRIAFLTTSSPSGSPAIQSFVEGLRD